MINASNIHVLAAVRLPSVARYREYLSKDSSLKPTVVTSVASAREILEKQDKPIDVFVIDNGLGHVFELIKQLRQSHPRLLILEVNEDADFGMPGRADDMTTQPFKDDELIRKIKRLAEERRLETLRADSLPPVRTFAKALHKAPRGLGRQQAAVEAVRELGYDYVAFYTLNATEPPSFTLSAQVGPDAAQEMVAVREEIGSLVGTVSQKGESRIVVKGDDPSHVLIESGKFGAAVCVPVGMTMRFGILLACREQSGSIKGDNVLMLEIICAQLAAALAKEQRS